MEIRLQAENKVYTTGEIISGKVLVKQAVSCEQLRISIVLIGKTIQSSVEPSQADAPIGKMQTVVTKLTPIPNSGSRVDYDFLRMHQVHHGNTLDSCYDDEIPISFLIPDVLPFDPCSALAAEETRAKAYHVQIPPSINHQNDRFCPEMCKITYYIYAEVYLGCGERISAKKSVRILPLYTERPPRLWGDPGTIQLSDATTLRTTLWTGSTGHLTVHASPHKSIYLPINDQERSPIAPIRLDLDLEVIGASCKLPQQCQFRAILEGVTYWSTTPMGDLPNGARLQQDPSGQVFRTSICLRKNKSVGLKWNAKDSETSGSHHATILVPVTMPKGVNIPPTFYHFYVSREYFIRIELVVGRARTLNLKLPFQVYNSLEN